VLLAEVTKTKSAMTKSGIANALDWRGMRAMNSGTMGATWRYPEALQVIED
jgi:hypothetical protein